MMMKLAASVFTIAVVLLAPEADAQDNCSASTCLTEGAWGTCATQPGGAPGFTCTCGKAPDTTDVFDEACHPAIECINNPCRWNGATGYCSGSETAGEFFCHCGAGWLSTPKEACPLPLVCKNNKCHAKGDLATCGADPADPAKSECLCSDNSTATDTCELVDQCKDNTCGEFGLCYADGASYLCFCYDGHDVSAGGVCEDPNPSDGSAFGLGCKAVIAGAAAFALL